MPSKSQSQRRLMGAALAAKRGNKSFPEAQKIAGQMSEKQLEDFAKNPVKSVKPKKPKSYLVVLIFLALGIQVHAVPRGLKQDARDVQGPQEEKGSPALQAAPKASQTLPPGEYTLSPGVYSITVASGGASPTPSPSPTPNPCQESPDKTEATPGNGKIIDSGCHAWAVSTDGRVTQDDAPAGYTANVTKIVYSAHVVYQTNGSGWWKWINNNWVETTDPSNPNPTPTPPPVSGKPGLRLFGGVSTMGTASGYQNPTIPAPDDLWKPTSKGQASGNQFPVNWYRDSDIGPIGYVNFSRQYWKDQMQKTNDWCAANGVNGVCQQLYYPHHVPGSWGSGQQIIDAFKAYLNDVKPYMRDGTYMIAINECLDNNGGSMNEDPLLSALGGKGATGWDGLIALVKIERQILPNVLLALNEYNICDWSSGKSFFNAGPAIAAYKACHDHGAALDWLGCEGYWFNSQGGSWQTYMDQINSIGSQILPTLTGKVGTAFIAFTEFTPDPCGFCGHCSQIWGTQKDCWEAILNDWAHNQYVFGITGPWGSFRASMAFTSGSWFYNNKGSVANYPDCVNVPNGQSTSSLGWLQGWVAANVH